jgi:hypothetical protein
MLDTFKDYAGEVKLAALRGDALMMISTVIIGSILANYNLNSNIIILSFIMYLLPYFIYK